MPYPYRLHLSLLAFVLLALGLALPSAASAATGPPNNVGTSPSSTVSPGPQPTLDTKVKYMSVWTCDLSAPADVQGYHVVCPGATFLDFYSADCCLPFDHWELKGKNWDDNPNTAVTTAPGPANLFGVPGRIYTYGATPLDSYIECTYIHGINVFPASSFILFASDAAACTVAPDPIQRRINRTP